jgi:hypothetical protein
VSGLSALLDSRQRDRDILRDALDAGELPAGPDGADSLPLTAPGGERIGILRYINRRYGHDICIFILFQQGYL